MSLFYISGIWKPFQWRVGRAPIIVSSSWPSGSRRGRREELCQQGLVFVLPPWTNVQRVQSKGRALPNPTRDKGWK
jgi:hypothetical protein